MAFGIYETDLGNIKIVQEGDEIVGVSWCKEEVNTTEESPLTKRAYTQLVEYFSGERKTFDLPIRLEGTPFQLRVWKKLLTIGYGEKRTYKEVGESIGMTKGARSIGRACNKNPIGVIVPCHRVVGADRSLKGYAGGIEVKNKLLALEEDK